MKIFGRKERWLAWLCAAVMTAALFVLAFACLDMRYATNDDSVILRAFMGYETGTPARFNIYVHGLLAWPMHWLGAAFPGVPWFSWIQLGLLAAAITTCLKSIIQCFGKRGRPLWLGAAAALAFALCFGVKYVTLITYTQTAALLGTAAVMQILSIDYERETGRRVVLGMLGAALLAALAYALRQITLLAVLAFCGLAFVLMFCRHYGMGRRKVRSAAPMVLSLALIAALLGGMALWREAEIRALGMEEHLQWQQARISLVDYHDVTAIPQEALDEVNWSPATQQLVANWCFLDENVTTEAFQTLTARMEAQDNRTFAQKLTGAFAVMQDTAKAAPQDMLCLALGVLAALLCVIGAVVQRERRAWLLGGVLGTLLLAAAMLIYLALEGRLPVRAVLMALLPAAGMLMALLPECLPQGRGMALTAVLLCVVHAGVCSASLLPELWLDREEQAALGSAMSDLEEYALWEPESLFIFDLTLSGADARLFPEYPDGMPHNVTFWGGWGMHTPENTQLFANYGIDLDAFDPETFLREDVFLVSGRIDPPPYEILNWLHEKVDAGIECEFWSEYGSVYVFHFYQP